MTRNIKRYSTHTKKAAATVIVRHFVYREVRCLGEDVGTKVWGFKTSRVIARIQPANIHVRGQCLHTYIRVFGIIGKKGAVMAAFNKIVHVRFKNKALVWFAVQRQRSGLAVVTGLRHDGLLLYIS